MLKHPLMIIGLNSSRFFNFRGAFCQSLEGVCKKKHQSWCRVWVGFHLRKLFATGISSHLFTPGTGNQSLQEGRDLGAMICLTRINSTERSKLGNRAAMYFTVLSRQGREGESLKGLWKEGSRWWTCCSRWGRAWPRCGRQSNWWPGWRGRCSTLLLRLSRWGWRSTSRPSWWLALEVRQVSVLLSQSRCRVAPESS